MPQIQATNRVKAVLKATKSARFNADHTAEHPHPYKYVADMLGMIDDDEGDALHRHILECVRCKGLMQIINAALDQAEALDACEGAFVCPPPTCPSGNHSWPFVN